jgi:serine/threonine protein kinase
LPARWRRLDELFAAAVDLPTAERRAFVTWTCADDPDLRLRLEELLDADPDSEGFLARAVAAGLAADREARGGGDSTPGEGEGLQGVEGLRRVGPYRLLREIGRGGTGRVFVAERAEGGFGQRVAVKLLRPGMDSEEILKRFATERSILARLEHPGIARLYDGGTTADGRPYFVMEAIDGHPIDLWASERKVDLPGRLVLFLKVCRAVHYAHQNLVVHRDLKPSNVLVTGAGEPKLLDFGIAKLLDPDLSHEATHTALRPMTPGYASPEQVRGGTVTTASDVYALGVLLYRLLTGRHPYRLEGSSAAELERRITEEDPPAPSSVAVRAHDRRRLAGDLDNVVARAMEKRPACGG